MQADQLNNYTCKPSASLCVPSGDDRRFIVTVRDQFGDLVDISGATEIHFVVAASIGMVPLVEKKLSDGDVLISTNMHQFWFSITSAESLTLPNIGYYEIQLTNSDGEKGTILSGPFRAPRTMIQEIV
jgi:hypothetical protein